MTFSEVKKFIYELVKRYHPSDGGVDENQRCNT